MPTRRRKAIQRAKLASIARVSPFAGGFLRRAAAEGWDDAYLVEAIVKSARQDPSLGALWESVFAKSADLTMPPVAEIKPIQPISPTAPPTPKPAAPATTPAPAAPEIPAFHSLGVRTPENAQQSVQQFQTWQQENAQRDQQARQQQLANHRTGVTGLLPGSKELGVADYNRMMGFRNFASGLLTDHVVSPATPITEATMPGDANASNLAKHYASLAGRGQGAGGAIQPHLDPHFRYDLVTKFLPSYGKATLEQQQQYLKGLSDEQLDTYTKSLGKSVIPAGTQWSRARATGAVGGSAETGEVHVPSALDEVYTSQRNAAPDAPRLDRNADALLKGIKAEQARRLEAGPRMTESDVDLSPELLQQNPNYAKTYALQQEQAKALNRPAPRTVGELRDWYNDYGQHTAESVRNLVNAPGPVHGLHEDNSIFNPVNLAAGHGVKAVGRFRPLGQSPTSPTAPATPAPPATTTAANTEQLAALEARHQAAAARVAKYDAELAARRAANSPTADPLANKPNLNASQLERQALEAQMAMQEQVKLEEAMRLMQQGKPVPEHLLAPPNPAQTGRVAGNTARPGSPPTGAGQGLPNELPASPSQAPAPTPVQAGQTPSEVQRWVQQNYGGGGGQATGAGGPRPMPPSAAPPGTGAGGTRVMPRPAAVAEPIPAPSAPGSATSIGGQSTVINGQAAAAPKHVVVGPGRPVTPRLTIDGQVPAPTPGAGLGRKLYDNAFPVRNTDGAAGWFAGVHRPAEAGAQVASRMGQAGRIAENLLDPTRAAQNLAVNTLHKGMTGVGFNPAGPWARVVPGTLDWAASGALLPFRSAMGGFVAPAVRGFMAGPGFTNRAMSAGTVAMSALPAAAAYARYFGGAESPHGSGWGGFTSDLNDTSGRMFRSLASADPEKIYEAARVPVQRNLESIKRVNDNLVPAVTESARNVAGAVSRTVDEHVEHGPDPIPPRAEQPADNVGATPTINQPELDGSGAGVLSPEPQDAGFRIGGHGALPSGIGVSGGSLLGDQLTGGYSQPAAPGQETAVADEQIPSVAHASPEAGPYGLATQGYTGLQPGAVRPPALSGMGGGVSGTAGFHETGVKKMQSMLEQSGHAGGLSDDQKQQLAASTWQKLPDEYKRWVYLGVPLAALGLMGSLFGGGDDDEDEDGKRHGGSTLARLAPLLGLGGLGMAGYGLTGGNLGQLGSGQFWRGLGSDLSGLVGASR